MFVQWSAIPSYMFHLVFGLFVILVTGDDCGGNQDTECYLYFKERKYYLAVLLMHSLICTLVIAPKALFDYCRFRKNARSHMAKVKRKWENKDTTVEPSAT